MVFIVHHLNYNLYLFFSKQGQAQAVEIKNGYDPGLCANSSHGKLKIVKNREDKDTLLVCFQEQGVYKWKMTDGEKHTYLVSCMSKLR